MWRVNPNETILYELHAGDVKNYKKKGGVANLRIRKDLHFKPKIFIGWKFSSADPYIKQGDPAQHTASSQRAFLKEREKYFNMISKHACYNNMKSKMQELLNATTIKWSQNKTKQNKKQKQRYA